MKIRFDLEDDDLSVLQNKNVHVDFYLDSYLEVFVIDDNKEMLLFFTTIHSTIVIDFNQLLIELHQTGKEQVLDTFGNANVYTFKKVGSNLLITNFDEFSNSVEWQYTYDFKEFLKAYTKGLRLHLQNLIIKDAKIVKRPDFILLKERLKSLEEVVLGK